MPAVHIIEADLARARTREGMAVAKAEGRLSGKQPTLKARQEAHLELSCETQAPDAVELRSAASHRLRPGQAAQQHDQRQAGSQPPRRTGDSTSAGQESTTGPRRKGDQSWTGCGVHGRGGLVRLPRPPWRWRSFG